MKVAIAKHVDLEARIKHEERKLNEIQDPKYSDDLRNRIEDRIGKLRGELTERNKEIDILKGEASKQINQIKESVITFGLTSGSGFTISTSLDLTSGLSFSPSRLIFTFIPILQLGDDISILLL